MSEIEQGGAADVIAFLVAENETLRLMSVGGWLAQNQPLIDERFGKNTAAAFSLLWEGTR